MDKRVKRYLILSCIVFWTMVLGLCGTARESAGTVLIDLFLFSSVNLRQPAIVFVAKQGDVTKLAGISWRQVLHTTHTGFSESVALMARHRRKPVFRTVCSVPAIRCSAR